MSLSCGWFCRPNLHVAVDRNGVAADDLAIEPLGEMNCQCGLPAGSRSGENERAVAQPRSPQTPPACGKDAPDARAENTEEKHREG